MACVACGATILGDAAIEIPGVTAIDGQHASRASAPRKVRRTFGSLFARGGDEALPPSQAELPALAMPGAEVRREMLRLRLDAELADLTARAEALAAERGVLTPEPPSVAEAPGAEPELGVPPDADTTEPPADEDAGPRP